MSVVDLAVRVTRLIELWGDAAQSAERCERLGKPMPVKPSQVVRQCQGDLERVLAGENPDDDSFTDPK